MIYVLDTNVFNDLLDRKIDISVLPREHGFVATGVQMAEIKATPDPERRLKLLSLFETVAQEHRFTESFVWGVQGSGWGESKWSNDGGQRLKSLKQDLDARKRRKNNMQDALIAEVAHVNGYSLVTADSNLRKVAFENGILVRRL